MRKSEIVLTLCVVVIFLLAIKSFADIRISNIDVDLVNKSAQFTEQEGSIVNGVFKQDGVQTTKKIRQPAYDVMFNSLTQQNALNLNVVQNYLSNN